MIIRRNLYSGMDYYQKDFSKVSEIARRTTRIGKGLSKGAANAAREAAAFEVRSDISAIPAIANIVENKLMQRAVKKSTKNPKLGREIVKEALKKGDTRVFQNNKVSKVTNNGKFNYFYRLFDDEAKKNVLGKSESLKSGFFVGKDAVRDSKKVLNSLGKRRGVINIDGDYSENLPIVSHEVGHSLALASKNPKEVATARTAAIARMRQGSDNLKGQVRKTYKNESAILADEKLAWEKALQLEKEKGATEKELRELRRVRRHALNTYKTARVLNTLGAVSDKIRPSKESWNEVKDLLTK